MSSNNKNGGKKGAVWFKCQNCCVYITNVDLHSTNCPFNRQIKYFNFISKEEDKYGAIFENVLYGFTDLKTNEDIKGLSSIRKERLVFLSQSVFELCSLSIEDWVIINFGSSSKKNDENGGKEEQELVSIARQAWPTKEKSVYSILFTKSGTEPIYLNKQATIQKANLEEVKQASTIFLNPINLPKTVKNFTEELQTRIKKIYTKGQLLTKKNIISLLFYGNLIKLQITDIEERKQDTKTLGIENLSLNSSLNKEKTQFYQTTEETIFKLNLQNEKEESKINNQEKEKNKLELIGGLDKEIEELELLIKRAFSCDQTGINRRRRTRRSIACLLYGASGTGKTLLSEAIALKSNFNIIRINPIILYESNEKSPDELIKDLFKNAKNLNQNQKNIVLIDEIDLICPSRFSNSKITDSEKRIISCLLNEFDDLNSSEDFSFFIIGTTNKRENLDVAFRRTGRFDKEIEIPIPNPKGRLEILKKNFDLDLNLNVNKDHFLEEIAFSTHGYVGSDLLALINEASLNAFRRNEDFVDVEKDDFVEAMKKIRPSAMRAVQVEVPNVKWCDIGGQENLKLILKQSVEWPLKYGDKFIRMGITPPRGVLMFGPPGCSKTMIAKAVATESGLNFLSIKGPEIFNKWVGESERAIREIFQKARQVAPSIVFFDEIDAIGGERSTGNSNSTNVQERVLAQLLTELDGVTSLGEVTILAATNRPDRIDKALLRPGRLDRIVYVPLPDPSTRKDILKIKFKKMPIDEKVNIDNLVELTEGYSGAEVNALCQEAAMVALQESFDAEKITQRHFEDALKIITPRTPQSLLNIYKEYLENKK